MKRVVSVLLWAAFGAGLAAAGLIVCHIVGCASPQLIAETASAEKCWEQVQVEIAKARDCKTAVANITGVIRRAPECSATLRDMGLTLVCHEDAPATDGGTDAN